MSGRPVKVIIAYCAECGYEPQTLELARALMYACSEDISAIEIVPWFEGSFDVTVDGELVHAMMRDGGFPDKADIIGAVRRQRTRVVVGER